MAWKNKPVWWAGSIYVITNTINGMQYVGLAELLLVRWAGHIKAVRRKTKLYVHNAMAAYGVENFRFEILQHCRTQETMRRAERKWIRKLHTFVSDPLGGGYNLTLGGDGVCGLRHSKASRRKMSVSHLLRYEDPAVRALVAAATRRQLADPEQFLRWYTSNSAAHRTPAARKRASRAQKKRYADPIKAAAAMAALQAGSNKPEVRHRQSLSAKARWAGLSAEERSDYWEAIHPDRKAFGEAIRKGVKSPYARLSKRARSAYWYATHPNGGRQSRKKAA